MGKKLFKIVILFQNITVLRLGEDNVSQTFKNLTDAKPLKSSVHLQRLNSVLFYLIIKNIESFNYWHIIVDLTECRRKMCLCCCLTKTVLGFFHPQFFADVHEWISHLGLKTSWILSLATGEEQWCGLTLGFCIHFFLRLTERCFTFLVSGVSSSN